jgi:hydroxyacylglutathione hydrolase
MTRIVHFESEQPNPNYPAIRDIDASELREKLAQVCVIDVRRPDEFTGELGHIAGAKLMTLNALPQTVAQLPKDQTIVFVCLAGGRSAQATALALQHGFTDVYNMQGGMMLWNELGYEIER